MDNETRVLKMLQKAIRKGWKNYINKMILQYYIDQKNVFYLNPDFLKAYFGEEQTCPNCGENVERLVKEMIGHSDWSICPYCWRELDTPISKFTSAHIYHAHKILDLILEENNPLEYFDKFGEG